MIPDAEMIEMVRRLRREATDALAEGVTFYRPQIRPIEWIALLDQIEDKAPRNVPAILRDNTTERLEAVADRLERLALAQEVMK